MFFCLRHAWICMLKMCQTLPFLKKKNTNARSNSNISLASIQKCSLSWFFFFFFSSRTFHLIIHHTAHCISLNAATMLACRQLVTAGSSCSHKKKKQQTVKKTNTPRPGGGSRVRTHWDCFDAARLKLSTVYSLVYVCVIKIITSRSLLCNVKKKKVPVVSCVSTQLNLSWHPEA